MLFAGAAESSKSCKLLLRSHTPVLSKPVSHYKGPRPDEVPIQPNSAPGFQRGLWWLRNQIDSEKGHRGEVKGNEAIS